MKARIEEIMRHERLTSTSFADMIGIQRAAMSHILKERNNVSIDVYKKILDKFKYVDPDWLLSGVGSMMRNTPPTSSPKQQDLFESNPQNLPENRPKVQDAPEYRPKMEVEKPQIEGKDLFTEVVIPKKTESRIISKIMIYYTDNTFETFIPEKNEKD
ncbi:transcriptional regulator with XRE-family HTH domain [Parabacteroides sp. PF5-5]|uniref:helix-turn-helix domain-containing protein n=1 Tax=unclassified Parabacteroides TaxID=2649774 RepID=UPI002474E17D|nr:MULTISPECIES: helix-turn-helix transcriptional regulator [unclassified Parabacteroides]MDH6314424.1 transcriptional regulator with XRE-family HTH domain [Parabacteroides sp. PF5-13]MDH6325724.1 transcriptional regulator with XRE-family HTH domain [Parabacteroides sp. PH5-41]MDH6333413.1 transcriptional regulator with XRE-family HTH domain [Parabacteroides sp. PF5-5]MDH6344589.1 transcriptional regulator with XRE-family HTH domain [Parabacteroides sp. PH5-46]MDH6359434.1 transcriptional regu